MNAANLHRKNIRLGGQGDSLGSLQEWTYHICATQKLSRRMRYANSSGILKYKTDHLISARWSDLIIINKKKRICRIVDFTVPADHRVKLSEVEKRDKYLDLARELKKLWNMKVTIIPIIIGAKTRGLGNDEMGRDCPNYSIIEISQNTEKSPGDLKRLAVTQPPVKDHQLMLMWKILKK